MFIYILLAIMFVAICLAVARIRNLEGYLSETQEKLNSIEYDKCAEGKSILDGLNNECTKKKSTLDELKAAVAQNNNIIDQLLSKIKTLEQQQEQLYEQNKAASNKLLKARELYKSIEYAIHCRQLKRRPSKCTKRLVIIIQ